MNRIPNPDTVFPNEYGTSCFLKNVITAPNIFVGDYTYYDDPAAPADFEKNNVLFNWPEFGDRLIIGKFCAIGKGVEFVMNGANHRMASVTTYPFNIFAHGWEKCTPTLDELPFKGDTVLKVRRRTFPSSHSRAIPLWAAMYGWGGNAPSCRA